MSSSLYSTSSSMNTCSRVPEGVSSPALPKELWRPGPGSFLRTSSHHTAPRQLPPGRAPVVLVAKDLLDAVPDDELGVCLPRYEFLADFLRSSCNTRLIYTANTTRTIANGSERSKHRRPTPEWRAGASCAQFELRSPHRGMRALAPPIKTSHCRSVLLPRDRRPPTPSRRLEHHTATPPAHVPFHRTA